MSGDSSAVRAGANAYLSFTSQLSTIISGLNTQVSQVVGPDWRSDGAASFGGAWANVSDDFGQLESTVNDFANQLMAVAGKIDDINHLHDVLHGLELAAGVGLALSFFTFGISDAEAAAAAATALTVEGEITVAETAADALVTTTLDAVLSTASRVLLTFAKRFAIGGAVWGGGTAASELVFSGHIDWGTVANNAIAGGLAEGLIPAGGPLSATLAKRLVAQGWVQGTLVTSFSEAETKGGNPLTWDWGKIDLNALETSLGNVAGGTGARVAGRVLQTTVLPHLPAGVTARIPHAVPSNAYVGRHRPSVPQ